MNKTQKNLNSGDYICYMMGEKKLKLEICLKGLPQTGPSVNARVSPAEFCRSVSLKLSE